MLISHEGQITIYHITKALCISRGPFVSKPVSSMWIVSYRGQPKVWFVPVFRIGARDEWITTGRALAFGKWMISFSYGCLSLWHGEVDKRKHLFSLTLNRERAKQRLAQ